MNSGYIRLEETEENVVIDDEKITILFKEYSQDKAKLISNKWFDVVESNSRLQRLRCCYLVMTNEESSNKFGVTFAIKFWFYKYKDSMNPSEIRATSHGFTNFFNKRAEPCSLKNIRNKTVFSGDVKIDGKTYSILFLNETNPEYDVGKANNLFPYAPVTGCIIRSKDKLGEDDIIPIHKYLSRMLQFVTFNNYTRIDSFLFGFTGGCSSSINETKKPDVVQRRMNQCLSFSSFGESAKLLMNFFSDYIEKPYNLFHLDSDFVYERDIPVMTGQFEYLFSKFIEKSADFKTKKTNIEKHAHKDDLMKMLKEFEHKNKVDNSDFASLKSEISQYCGTLREKLDFIFKDFCKTTKLKVLQPIYLKGNEKMICYSPEAFAERLKTTRNSLCHGLYKKGVSLEYGNDSFVLQELMYFTILKYSVKCSNKDIRKVFSSGFFKEINIDLGFESPR
jgi:hypothetical protein